MFSSLLVCKFVLLFICLLAILRENAWTDFMKFSGYVGQDTRNTLENLGSGMFKPLHKNFLLICFQGNPCL